MDYRILSTMTDEDEDGDEIEQNALDSHKMRGVKMSGVQLLLASISPTFLLLLKVYLSKITL